MTFVLMSWLAVAAATCAPELASRAWINAILDPARDVAEVRDDLADVLVPTSPLDREVVMRVASRCCAGGLEPEVAWPVDGRWMLYRDPPRPARLFTVDLAREVMLPELVAELDRRVLSAQHTDVTPHEIVTEVPIHRLGSACRVRRRVRVDGREHQTAAVARLGYDDAPAEVRRLLERLDVVETLDHEAARRRLRVPRFGKWPRRTQTLGRAFADVRYTELRLSSAPVPGPGDTLIADLPDLYLHALASGTVPLILDRWEVDEAIRHAVGALLLPPTTLRWFQSAAARLNELRSRAEGDRLRDLDAIGVQLMRQFSGLLDLSSLVIEGRLNSYAEFASTAEFVWPGLTLPAEVMPATMFQASTQVVARLLGKHRLPGIDEPGTLDATAARAVAAVHREMVRRRAELIERKD